MFRFGYDLYRIDKHAIFLFLRFAKKKKIKILHLKYKEDMYQFYIPTYQRYLLNGYQEPLIYQQTIGLLKYILFLTHHFLNIIGIVCFFISVMMCSYLIFNIQVIGTMPLLNKEIKNELKEQDVTRYSLLKSYEHLNDILSYLKTTYKEDVEYINVYQVGSVFYIEYTKKEYENIEKESYSQLYAKKDGLIYSTDVQSGLIKVKKNDYVKKGDLLVDNTIISTQNKTQIIPVKGCIYAYVYEQYEASVKNINQDQAEVFYQLLLSIRNQIPTNAVIDKENVLQIVRTRSKITLKMHYTLIEDIAIKGESNEENH